MPPRPESSASSAVTPSHFSGNNSLNSHTVLALLESNRLAALGSFAQLQAEDVRSGRTAQRFHARRALCLPVGRYATNAAGDERLARRVSLRNPHQGQKHLTHRRVAGRDEHVVQAMDRMGEGNCLGLELAVDVDRSGLRIQIGVDPDAVFMIQFQRNQRHRLARVCVAQVAIVDDEAHGQLRPDRAVATPRPPGNRAA